LTDVHANLPALEAAISAIEVARCDEIIHLGDAIGIGPFPAETLETLLSLSSFHSVMGNHDAWFVEGVPSELPPHMSEGEAEHFRWTHAQLNPGMRAIVEAWPYSINMDISQLRITFVHYPFNEESKAFAPIAVNATPDDLDALFTGVPGDLIWYGHHHPKSDLFGRARYVNPGSLGCAKDGLARFAILSVKSSGDCAIDFQETPYDTAPLFRAFEERQVPERAFIQKAFFNHSAEP
jgi:predicted phosphodiesterase